ncbi:MAG: hypothetical protein J6W19_03170 [Prevotella sp.]|nr:hypothetical protein [Prevotella sp.]
MIREIAVNTQHMGDPRQDHRGYAESWTSEQVDSLLSEDWLRKMVADIRGGNEALKDRLPYLCPHYSAFKDNHRAQKDIIPEAFTFMTCVDVDDKTLVAKAIQKAMEVNVDEYSDWQNQVLRIEYSARKKVHIYIRIPKGMTIEEAQRAFCQEIEVPYDESCITPERFIYVTGKDEEVYRSEHWLEPLSEEEIAERREAYLERGLDVDGRRLTTTQEIKTTTMTARPLVACKARTKTTIVGDNLSPDDRTRFIFKACMEEAELEPEALVVEGARHNAVKSILSVGAAQLLTKGEFSGVLSEMMPDHWQDKNIQDLLNDFYEKYTDSSQKMTQFQRRVFAKSRKIGRSQAEKPAVEAESEAPQSELSKLYASQEPPQMPRVLPKLVKATVSRTPDLYKPTVAQAIFPALATYPRKIRFTYIDNQDRELRINCLIVAETAAGKDSCIRQPIAHILADMKLRDERNRDRLKKFNEDYNGKAANKEKPKRPADLIIQTIKSDITKAALVQRMDESQGAPLHVKLNELEQWDKVECATGKSNQFTNLKLNDDEDNDFGADRASAQSVTASVSLHLNWNANATVSKALRYFRYVLVDGPLSRLCMATIPDREIGSDIPVFGNYDNDYDEALRPYIENLKQATGTIDCREARRLASRLEAECKEFARLSQDRVFDNLTHRALVHAFRKACLLYAANGMKWEKAIESFCRWSLHYDLWIKMKLWGEQIRHADEGLPTSKRGPRNLLEQIKTDQEGVFTYRDVVTVRLKNGMDEEGTVGMLRQWKHRGYILQMTDDSFKKARTS